jgi:hypothetical protein
MKTFGGAVIILLFAVVGWAQTGKADCPQIRVSGPAGVPGSVGEEMPFVVSIAHEPAGRALEFVWTASSGKIVRGQGTRDAVVTGWKELGLTVTVEIKGLSAGCPTSAAETMSYDPPRAYSPDCPRITVSGPAGTVMPGDPAPFTLVLTDEPQRIALEIVWTASDGKIVRGHEPRQIEVAEWNYNKNITVTAEVKGLPPGCPSSASETMGIFIHPQPRLIDEYGPAAFAAVKEYLLDSAAKDFHEHQPPYPAKFRNVRIGHLGDVTKSGGYRLCGEFLPAGGGGKSEWTKFATVKTSGYEQYLGSTEYCTDKKIRWDTKGDLAAVLKGKFDASKKD